MVRTSPGGGIMKRTALTRLGGLVIGVLVLAVFIYVVGIDELTKALLQVDPRVIAIMTGIQLLGLVFYASAWFLLIRAAGHRISFLTCQGIAFASIFAAYTLPSGIFMEAMRVLLGSRESGMKLGESTATVILHRVLYILGFLASTALALLALVLGGRIASSMILELSFLPVLAVIGLAILLYISFDPRKFQPILDRFLRLVQPLVKVIRKEAETHGRADQFLSEYHGEFRRLLTSKTQIAASFVASLGDWGCSVLILWVVLISLGVEVGLAVVILSMAIGKMIQMTPIAVPGMLGIYEAGITTFLALFGVPVAVAASAALLLRIITFWLELPVTGLAAYHYGFKMIGRRVLSLRPTGSV
jgi:uncharacterized protein (TIRG00374 family)